VTAAHAGFKRIFRASYGFESFFWKQYLHLKSIRDILTSAI
jgi:hypothetical protein